MKPLMINRKVMSLIIWSSFAAGCSSSNAIDDPKFAIAGRLISESGSTVPSQTRISLVWIFKHRLRNEGLHYYYKSHEAISDGSKFSLNIYEDVPPQEAVHLDFVATAYLMATPIESVSMPTNGYLKQKIDPNSQQDVTHSRGGVDFEKYEAIGTSSENLVVWRNGDDYLPVDTGSGWFFNLPESFSCVRLNRQNQQTKITQHSCLDLTVQLGGALKAGLSDFATK